MQCLRRYTDHPNTQTSMKKSLVEISPLKGWHSSILASLTIEEQVGRQDRASKYSPAIEDFAGEGACIRACVGRRLGVFALQSVSSSNEG